MDTYVKQITHAEYLAAHTNPESGFNKMREQMLADGLISSAERAADRPLTKDEYAAEYDGDSNGPVVMYAEVDPMDTPPEGWVKMKPDVLAKKLLKQKERHAMLERAAIVDQAKAIKKG